MASERTGTSLTGCESRRNSKSKLTGALPPGYALRGYATRKTVAQGMLDLALLLANGSQLKALIQTPEENRDYLFIPVLTLIGLSVGIQICVGILIIILGNMEAKTEREQIRANAMNNATVGLILFITVLNVFISAFGIKFSGQERSSPLNVVQTTTYTPDFTTEQATIQPSSVHMASMSSVLPTEM